MVTRLQILRGTLPTQWDGEWNSKPERWWHIGNTRFYLSIPKHPLRGHAASIRLGRWGRWIGVVQRSHLA